MLPIICIALVLHLGHSTGGARYWYGHIEACGSGLLWHGLHFSIVRCTVRLISVEKDWKHASIQKVVTLNTCCDTACLTLQLPHITTGTFKSHWWQPSALTLLVGQQEGHPACRNWVVGCWHGYLSGVRCRLAYSPADANATHCLLLQ